MNVTVPPGPHRMVSGNTSISKPSDTSMIPAPSTIFAGFGFFPGFEYLGPFFLGRPFLLIVSHLVSVRRCRGLWRESGRTAGTLSAKQTPDQCEPSSDRTRGLPPFR